MELRNWPKGELAAFEETLGVKFQDPALLSLAFCHRSYVNEQKDQGDSNEKLEFLGDSVLGLVVCEYLYQVFPTCTEGGLAKVKSFVVSEESLAEIAFALGIGPLLLVGKGEESSGGRQKKAILADTMEAIFGAYYLDAGFDKARNLILALLIPQIEKVLVNKHKQDYKTLLQEFCQQRFGFPPEYKVVKEKGPDHSKEFWVEVLVQDQSYGPGHGKSKKEAAQEAAGIAYEALAKAG